MKMFESFSFSNVITQYLHAIFKIRLLSLLYNIIYKLEKIEYEEKENFS